MSSAKTYMIAFQLGAKVQSSFSSAFKQAGQQLGLIGDQAERANKRFNSMRTTVSNLTKSVIGLGAAYVGIDAAKSLVGGAIESASSLEGYRNTLNVVMKDQKKAAETMQWAVNFANKTPFETDQVVDATVRLQSYGLQAKKVLPIVGDMAGVMNKDVMAAVEAVADAQTGELERLKEFGITKAMIAKKAGAMYKNQEIINNKGQIVNQEKFNNALFALMNDKFKGGMDIQAGSFKGTISTITGVWKSGLATIAGMSPTGEIVKGSFFDILKQKAKSLGETLTKMQANGTFDELQKNFSNFASTAVSAIESVGPKVMDFFNYVFTHGPQISSTAILIGKAFIAWKVISGLSAGIQTIVQLAGALSILKTQYLAVAFAKAKDLAQTLYLQALYAKDAIVTGAKTVATRGLVAAQAAWNVVTTVATAVGTAFGAVLTFLTSPIGLVIIAIMALIAIGVALYKNWDVVKAKAGELWGSVKNIFGKIGSFIGGVWSGVKASAIGAVNTIIGGLNTLIRGANSIKIKVPDWVPKLGGKSFGLKIPQIPKLAAGGVTTGPTLAMIGEGKEQEAVLPLSKLMSLLNGKGLDNNGSGENDSVPGINFNPQIIIQGNADEAVIQQALGIAFKEFKRLMDKYEAEKKRLKFS
jgi:hypothetical protein